MTNADQRDAENDALRRRLSQLSEASLRINESLDLDRVLQGVMESTRSLTGARAGVMLLFDDSGEVQQALTSGMTGEQQAQLWDMADGMLLLRRIGGLTSTVRHPDFNAYLAELGLPEFRAPVEVHSPLPFLFTPITYEGRPIGAIYLGDTASGEAFTEEDEETLVMFASQAALVIANARYHRDERRARNDLEALVDSTPVAVLVFDPGTGLPISFNREVVRIADEFGSPGQSPEEVINVLTVRRANGEELSLQELPLTSALLAGETVRAEEITLSVPDGRSMTALLNVTPIHSETGAIESVVVTAQDLRPLEEAERMRAEFLAMVSRELRAPLSSIRGSAATLLEEQADLQPAEAREFFRIINEQAGRMRRLISDLLDVAQIETGNLSVSATPAEVRDLVDEARNSFASSGGRNDIQVELPPDLPLVMADRPRIVQVITNLLSNAARHSSELSAIHLGAEFQSVHVALTITDSGRGIPAEHLPQLFRKFARAEGEEADTGLGLAICKGIVEAHGGRIWAESDGPGQGARFTFTLPSVAGVPTPEPVPDSHSQREASRVAAERPRVLVVDDDPQMLRYVRDVLSRANYTSTVTGEPAEVADLMHEVEPHLVLLDLVLPGADGIELMQTIRNIAQVPVIFLSAYGQDHVIARAFEMGAADYMVKPFSPTELTARIQAALRRQSELSGQDVITVPYLVGDLAIDHAQRRVTLGSRPIELTDTEYRLLAELAANAGRILTHQQLTQRLWGPYKPTGSAPVRGIVNRLRQKLGDDASNPTYIFTRHRVGYWIAKGGEDSGEPASDN